MAEDLEDDIEDNIAPTSGERPVRSGTRRAGGKKFLLIIVFLVILLIGGGAAGLYLSGFISLSDEDSTPAETTAERTEQLPPGMSSIYYDLRAATVNLNTSGRRQALLKLRVSLELKNALDINQIEAVLPKVEDAMQSYLREFRIEDLQGTAGLLRLKEELLARINAIVAPAKVEDVLIREMLIQ